MNETELYWAHLTAMANNDHEAWFALFAPDGTVEYPFSATIGYPTQLAGQSQIRAFCGPFLASVENFVALDARVLVATGPVGKARARKYKPASGVIGHPTLGDR